MKFKKFLHSRAFYALACVLIIIGIILSLLLPGIDMNHAHVQDPISGEISDITLLFLSDCHYNNHHKVFALNGQAIVSP